MKAGREFEELAARIYAELESTAVVTLDDRILGESGVERQVDVSVRTKAAGVDLLIAIDTKDYGTRRADVGKVDEFANKLRDIRANKGILICRSGFSKGAISAARKWGIELANLHDAASRDWRMDIQFPILWTDLAPRIRWDMVVQLQEEDSFPTDPARWSVLDASGSPYDLLADFEASWNDRRIPRESGVTHVLDNKAEGLQLIVDSSGKPEPRRIVELSTKYQVDSQSYLGWFTPEECRGVFSYIDGRFQPSYLDIGSVPVVRDPTWPRIDDPSRLAIEPVAPLVVTASPKVERSSFRGALGEVQYLGPTYP